MSYSPKHNYRAKDQLSPGDPEKIIYGSDLSDDFEAIAKEVSLLNQIDIDGDGTINIPPELIEGLGGLLDAKADQTDLDAEIAARDSGDANLQAQIDGLGSGGGASTWDELTGKPTEFPPESHTHEIADVNGLQDALDNADGTDYDDTQIKADLATETQARIDGDTALDLRIDAVEDSIADGGGFVDAPNDGKLYGRESEAWAEVVIPSTAWDDITSKPTEFPPSAHKHVIADVTGLQDALDNAGGVDYTLPVVLRSGNAQLPLTVDGAKLAVMTRGGELELPLAA